MSEEEEREWGFGEEDGGEYAYVDYAGGSKGKRSREEGTAARSDVDATRPRTSMTCAEDQEGAARAEDQLQQSERAAPWIPDAFCGHHCPICLDSTQDSAMIESCHHVYCKSCLFEWLGISDRCPLCKVKVSRVLFDIKSSKEYKLHLHVQSKSNSSNSNSDGSGRSSRAAPPSSSSSLSSSSRSVSASSSAAVVGASASASSREHRDGGAGGAGGRGAEFRSTVYRRGLAVEPPEPKARRPKSVAQLRPWIAREVHAAAVGRRGAGVRDTRLVADVVEALLKGNDVDEQEGYCTVKKELQDFLFEYTGPFLHELWCFRWSKAGISAYDRDAVYHPRRQGC